MRVAVAGAGVLEGRHAEARENRDRRQRQPSPSRHIPKAAQERQRLVQEGISRQRRAE